MRSVMERDVDLRLVLSKERSVGVTARFSYAVDDPYAVRMTFHLTRDTAVTWTFSRELLVEGTYRPCGHGDVRIWPTRAHGKGSLCLALTSPEGEALLEAPAAAVTAWLEDTLRAVPPGTEEERLDLDGSLAELFASVCLDELQREVRARREEGTSDPA